jgi:hypothetical protein
MRGEGKNRLLEKISLSGEIPLAAMGKIIFVPKNTVQIVCK